MKNAYAPGEVLTGQLSELDWFLGKEQTLQETRNLIAHVRSLREKSQKDAIRRAG